jgi:hypothetical protein
VADYPLPASSTPFIGRENELAEIRKRFADPMCRLLTLVGIGGIGKSRLAIEAARQTWLVFPMVYSSCPAAAGITGLDPIAIAEAARLVSAPGIDLKQQLVGFL